MKLPGLLRSRRVQEVDFHARRGIRLFTSVATRLPLSALLFSLLSITAAQAAAPAPDFLFPAGGKPGATFPVTVGGKLEGWPVGVWTSHPGLAFNAATNSGSFSVTIGADVPAGPHLVRFFNADGASEPRTFVVGRRDELLEVEPNDDFRRAQRVEQRASVINGRLEKSGDVDSFAIQAEPGKWVVAAVECYALGSSVDPVLQILDERGVRMAFNHDTHNLDAIAAWQATRAGTCYVQVFGFAHPPAADVSAKGSAAFVYRLTITTGPFARSAYPAGVRRGSKSPLALLGWNLDNTTQTVDGSRAQPADPLLFVPAEATGETLWLAVGDGTELTEAEPNDASTSAQRVTLPATLNGRIGRAGDVDRFAFTAKKNERFNFQVRAAALHSPLAALLRVEDTNGLSLVQQEGGDGTDPRLAWNAPADGTFVVAISDMYGSGSDHHFYRIETVSPPPHFTATIPVHALFVENGKTNEIKVTVTRVEGFKERLVLSVKGLPDGVTAKPAAVPDKSGEVKLELVAGADAKPASVPIEILISASDVRPPMSRAATFSLRGIEPRGDRLINAGHVAWLTVSNKPAPPPPKKKRK
ncbi:MAG: hypothetical protein HZA92_14805 [Verrucomicrobia bacterium]|nr:hypothetical protein [Verrucomicrobiota bacterium]